MTRRYGVALVVALLLLAAGVTIAWAQTTVLRPGDARPQAGQLQGTPSPVQLQFPTATETPGPPSETPTRTPTSAGRPMVEAISDATNVRAGPDINESRVGTIFPGTKYAVLGRRFDWYWIEFAETPAGTAWVYKDVVTLSGEASQIQELELEDIPTLDPVIAAEQQTAAAITQTPGAIASLTAQALVTPTGIFTPGPDQGPTLIPGQPLPTFTFPPYTPTPVVIPKTNPQTAAESDGIPPILPILALGAVGLLGLLVAFMRRL